MSGVGDKTVTVVESGNGPYAQFVTVGHHVMAADEPEQLAGHDTGPSPYEYLLAGLGACTAMTLRMYADRHGWPLRRVAVMLRHETAQVLNSTDITDRFFRRIEMDGNLTVEQRGRLLDIAERCPSQSHAPAFVANRYRTGVRRFDLSGPRSGGILRR
jgi:putative redox protein